MVVYQLICQTLIPGQIFTENLITDKQINSLNEWNSFQCFTLFPVIFRDNEED